jgi:hypothetical protein
MLKLLADAGVIPNNACMHSTRSRVHALTHAHAYTRTHMQRLYGKLDADSELPEVEDIEQIMAATIKQTAHEPDQGAAEDQLKPPALQPHRKSHLRKRRRLGRAMTRGLIRQRRCQMSSDDKCCALKAESAWRIARRHAV